jgi:hypothetical protein
VDGGSRGKAKLGISRCALDEICATSRPVGGLLSQSGCSPLASAAHGTAAVGSVAVGAAAREDAQDQDGPVSGLRLNRTRHSPTRSRHCGALEVRQPAATAVLRPARLGKHRGLRRKVDGRRVDRTARAGPTVLVLPQPPPHRWFARLLVPATDGLPGSRHRPHRGGIGPGLTPGHVLSTPSCCDRRVPQAPLPAEGVTPGQEDLAGPLGGRYPSFVAHTSPCARPNPSPRLGCCLSRRVLAGCRQPLLGDGPSRHDLWGPCAGARTRTPSRSAAAPVHSFTEDTSYDRVDRVR